MARYLLIIILCLFFYTNQAQNVSINDLGTPANPNAVLDVDISTNDKGILIPRITEAQKLAMSLTTTDEGLMIYQEDAAKGYWYWNGTKWERLKVYDVAFGEMSNDIQRKDTIPILAPSTWYKIPNLFSGSLLNVTYSNATLITQKAGYYYLQYSISGYSVTEKQNYEFAFIINGVANIASEIEQRIDRKINKESSVSGQCIVYLNAGDVVELDVKCDYIADGFVGTHGNVSIMKID